MGCEIQSGRLRTLDFIKTYAELRLTEVMTCELAGIATLCGIIATEHHTGHGVPSEILPVAWIGQTVVDMRIEHYQSVAKLGAQRVGCDLTFRTVDTPYAGAAVDHKALSEETHIGAPRTESATRHAGLFGVDHRDLISHIREHLPGKIHAEEASQNGSEIVTIFSMPESPSAPVNLHEIPASFTSVPVQVRLNLTCGYSFSP